MALYIVSTGLSLPGAATVLTLAGGALFGLWVGLVAISFSSTMGATSAFLASRFLLRDALQKKFSDKLQVFNKGIEREGALYLFTLRLVPFFPFFLINLLMGLSPIRTSTFFFVSQLGMLPGTAVYVNAGTQLGNIRSTHGVLSPRLILSFVIIGVLPLLSKRAIDVFKSRRHRLKFKKPKAVDYNIVVIGAGSAGLVSAYIAAAVRAKVALVEKNLMGGDCLNTGCVPSKALIKSAKLLYDASRSQDFGIRRLQPEFEFLEVMDRVQRVIKKIQPHDSVERYASLGVDCIEGVKVLTEPGTDHVLGATIVGSHAGDYIAEYVTAMKYHIGLNKILGTIHIYPTFAEANKYAAGEWKRTNAPQGVLDFLEKLHRWRRG